MLHTKAKGYVRMRGWLQNNVKQFAQTVLSNSHLNYASCKLSLVEANPKSNLNLPQRLSHRKRKRQLPKI